VVTQSQQFGVVPNQQRQPQQQFTAFPPPQQPPPARAPARAPFTAFSQTTQFGQQSQPQEQQPAQPPRQPPFTPLSSQFSNQPTVFRQGPKRFPPDESVGTSFGLSNSPGSQSSSEFTQSFRRPQEQQPPQQTFNDQEPESFRSSGGVAPSAIDNTFASFPGRVPFRQQFNVQPAVPDQQPAPISTEDSINGARVRIRPAGTIGNTDPTQFQAPQQEPEPPVEVTSPRARQPLLRTRPESSPAVDDFNGEPTPRGPTGVRVVRVRPGASRPFQTENFTPSEFFSGNDEATPPPVISRVRGRPIVPDDFPGNQQAIRGHTPEDDLQDEPPTGPGADFTSPGEGFDDQSSSELTGTRGRFPSATASGGRNNRGRVRIVPSGNRARRPISRVPEQPEQEPSEEPRASVFNSGRPINRIPFSALDDPVKEEQEDEDDFSSTGSGFPRRRLRPVSRVPPSAPRRRLRPFVATPEEVPQQEPVSDEVETFEFSVPTVPSRRRERLRVQDLLSQTFLNNANEGLTQTEDPSKTSTSGDAHFDPNHLLAHVQAVKAVEDSVEEELKKSRRPNISILDDSEESNIIPLSDIPTDSNNDQQDPKDITVISLQKDRSKQNFKSFVDSDHLDGNRQPKQPEPFFPTRSPPLATTTDRSSGPINDFSFRPTSRPTTSSTSRVFVPTTTPFVRVPFGPFAPLTTTPQKEEPKVSVSVSTSLSSSKSSSSSSSGKDQDASSSSTSSTTPRVSSINDELDRLQSNLDPWARIQQQLKESEEAEKQQKNQVTIEPTRSTPRLSLFNVRTLPTTSTTTTTTFKPRSLADLFRHREGHKIDGSSEETTTEEVKTTTTTTSRTTSSSDPTTTRSGGFNRFNRLNRFTVRPNTDNEEETTTSRPHLGGFRQRTTRGPTVGDLLASIPKDNVRGLLPKGFGGEKPKSIGFTRPSVLPSSIVQDDVSKFLPAGFKFGDSTTSTTTDISLLEDILSSIEVEDLEKLLPKDFQTRPKPLRPYQNSGGPSGSNRPNPSFKPRSPLDKVFGNVKFDDVSSFLPPGFEMTSEDFIPTTTSTTTEKPDFKLDLSSLFDDIKTDSISDLLPPGFKETTQESAEETDKTAVSMVEKTDPSTDKIKLNFPSRPGGVKKGQFEQSLLDRAAESQGGYVPKILSFAER
jgi:hypothetical protein